MLLTPLPPFYYFGWAVDFKMPTFPPFSTFSGFFQATITRSQVTAATTIMSNGHKNKRKEPNGTKGPRAVKSEEIAVKSQDEAERQCSLSSISDSQDDVRQVVKRKVKRASRSRTRDENEEREPHEVGPLAEIKNLEMQRSKLVNHAMC